jgi:glycosyltransferase involved in cell wall biosynthesis
MVKKWDESFIRSKIHKKADGLIVISSLMEESYAGCRNMIKLPPLIDIEDSIWHQTMDRDDTFTFCFAGMLDGSKESLDTIVEAYSRLETAKVKLNIIGVTEEEFCGFYENGAERIKECKNELNFMGRFSHEETIKYVAACDSYIFIRQSDLRNNAGFPTKFSEAFSCGVPIITTDISDVKRYMEKGRGRILSSVSVDGVESAMREAIKSFEGREKTELNDTFHYGNYVDMSREWLDKIIN